MIDNWEDVVRRRKEGDPLMYGGNFRDINSIIKQDIRCTKCQSRNVVLDFMAVCQDCDNVWERRK